MFSTGEFILARKKSFPFSFLFFSFHLLLFCYMYRYSICIIDMEATIRPAFRYPLAARLKNPFFQCLLSLLSARDRYLFTLPVFIFNVRFIIPLFITRDAEPRHLISPHLFRERKSRDISWLSFHRPTSYSIS
jgi:hypothetical protein